MGTNYNASMLRYIAKNARIVQEEFPDIVSEWIDDGVPQDRIAVNRNLVNFLKIEEKDPEGIATSVVRMALYGFDSKSDRLESFKGLVSRSVYDNVVAEHRQSTLKDYNDNSPNSFVNMDKGRLGGISNKGVLARGRIPVSDEEKELAYECSLKSEYITPNGVSWEGVLVEVNDRFHNSRSNSSVRHMAHEVKEAKY